MDKSRLMGMDKSIRLRVLIDVRRLLMQKIKIKVRGGMEETFEIKYEKLPLFCFYCGHIGHGTKDCDSCKDEEDPDLAYGSWLKASPWKSTLSQGDTKQNGAEKQCARALFVTKPKKNDIQWRVMTKQILVRNGKGFLEKFTQKRVLKRGQ
ncbi:Gag polyprotein [Bienertia sinuspersici]